MVTADDLKKVGLFSVLSDGQLNRLAQISEKKAWSANAHIYEHGDPANFLYVVLSGAVALKEFKPDDPVGVAFEMRDPGELFGAACVMQPRQYTLTAVCLKGSEVLAIDANRLRNLCEADPLLGYMLVREIAQLYFDRYRLAKRRLFEMAQGPTVITALPG